MSMVTGPSASSVARSAGSRSTIRAVAAASPASVPRQCFSGEPARDPGRGRGGQPRHRRDLLAGRVGAHPVQPHQEVLPGQLGGGHPGQHLPAGKPPRPLLDRPHRLIEGLDQAELAAQLGDREHPARGGQRRVIRADLDLAACPPLTA